MKGIVLCTVILLPGCADLVIRDTNLVWNNTTKKLTATIENRPAFIPAFAPEAENFAVTFTTAEHPAATPAQIIRTITSLQSGNSTVIEADFAPLANAGNYYLWNSFQIAIWADPDEVVREGLFRFNNKKDVLVPFSSELPIVMIDSLRATIPDEPKIPGLMKITYDYLGGRNFASTTPNDYNGKIGIEARGASSQNFCQRQYGLETRDAANADLDVSLLQMPAEADWVLHAPYSDKTLMRNYLAYQTSNLIGRYAPRAKFVEGFSNDPGLARLNCPTPPSDNYSGVYLLMEKIKRDPNRVAVEKMTSADNAEPQITGGYILKIDWGDVTDVSFVTPAGTKVIYLYPKASTVATDNDITPQQKQWIQDYIEAFEAALSSASFADPATGYAKFIDVDSFVDYFILNELFKNYDAFRASTYMHKPRNGKLRMGPVWDFNLSMGQAFDASHSSSSGWILNTVPLQPFWWKKLLTDPNFAKKLSDRWQSLRTTTLATPTLMAAIDSAANQVQYAQARHFARWPILGTRVFGTLGNPPATETHVSNVQDMKTWLDARLNWVDQNIVLPIP